MLIAHQHSTKASRIAENNGLILTPYTYETFADGSCEFDFSSLKQEVDRFLDCSNGIKPIFLFYEFAKPMNFYATNALILIHFLSDCFQQWVERNGPNFFVEKCGSQTSMIYLVAPFMPFLRQKHYGALELFNDVQIITLDAHTPRSNLISVRPVFFEPYLSQADYIILPDSGAKDRYSYWIDERFIFARKDRQQGVKLSISDSMLQNCHLRGKNCLILDDMLDSGYTLQQTINELKKLDVGKLGACITHNLHGRLDNNQWGLDFLCVSDTLMIEEANCSKEDYAIAFDDLSRLAAK